MNFFKAMIDAVGGFVQRNPLFVLFFFFILACIVFTPMGVFSMFFSVLAAILLLFVILMLVLGYKVRKMQKQMKDQFNRQQGFSGSRTWESYTRAEETREETHSKEPEMKIYKTADTPQKKVSDNVGDYIDFEETKD